MRKFIFNDGQFEANIPEVFDEVTFKQFQDIQKLKEPKMIDIAAYFLETTPEVINQSKAVDGFYEILNCLSWVHDAEINQAVKPILINYKMDNEIKTVIIPRDIDYCIVAQFEDAKYWLSKYVDGDSPIKYYAEIVSIFLDALIFEKHNQENQEKTIPIVNNLPILEVIGLGNFFVTKFTELQNGTKKGVSTHSTRMKNWRLALRHFKLGAS